MGKIAPFVVGSAVLAAGVSASACGGPAESQPFAERDSAGVRIVESYRPLWEDGDGWAIPPEPILQLGVVEGEAALEFNGVTGLARLRDGTIVVADGGSQEVRYFDSGGRVVGIAGGAGEGPGEFTGLSGMGAGPEDRIWAWDFMLRRFTLLDPSGEMVDLVSLGSQPPMLNAVGILPDRTLVLKQLWAANTVAQVTEEGLRRDPVAVVRVPETGAVDLDTVTLVPGRELHITQEDGRGVMGTPPFGHNAVATPWGEGVVVGDQVAFELRKHEPTGRLSLISRIPDLDFSLKPGDLEAYVHARLEQVPEESRPAARENILSMPVPGTKPAFGGVLADAVGNLWVSEWVVSPRLPERWTVLDPSGHWLGEVGVPERFFPYAIGEDWILGVTWDDLDVEYVALYRIAKGARS